MISSEDQTPTLSATLLRKSHSHSQSYSNSHARTHNAILHFYRMDDLAVDSDEEVDYSKMDQVTTLPASSIAARVTTQLFNVTLVNNFIYVLHIFMLFVFQGNKKGPLGRWDFDTQEEYSDYMNNKEALPK